MKLPEPYTPAQRAAGKMARILLGDDLTPFIDALQAYGEACAKAALEEAAMVAQPADSYRDGWFEAKADSVRRIQAIKIEVTP